VVLLNRHLPDVSGDEVLVTLRDWGLDARVTWLPGIRTNRIMTLNWG